MSAGIDVAITTFRRPEMIVAAVRSCLEQHDWLNRVVVVDDASGDDTPARLAALGDERVLLHVRSENGGIGAARRDAMERCSTEWTVMIDSDHELLPGALREFATFAESVGPDVGIIGAQFRWDTGAVTPLHLPQHPIGYEDRIRWSTRPNSIGRDYVLCVSRRVREHVKWSAVRSGMVDALFQLDAAKIADAQFIGKCLAYQRSDGPEGHSRGTVEHLLARRRKDAPGGIALCEQILRRHGSALLRHGRPLLASTLKHGAICAALAGRRALAGKWALLAVSVGGGSHVTPGLVPACLAGPAVFEWAFRKSLIRGGAIP